jgi:salicylate hydroxylase
VLVSPNGMLALSELGISENVLAVSAHPAQREVRLWNTGHAWPTLEFNATSASDYGQPFAWRGVIPFAALPAHLYDGVAKTG